MPYEHTTKAYTTATPKVQIMKACIVSMEYTIKNNDGTPKLQHLSEMYSDGEKVKQLFECTLGWDKKDV
jgi:hypothetical protein